MGQYIRDEQRQDQFLQMSEYEEMAEAIRQALKEV